MPALALCLAVSALSAPPPADPRGDTAWLDSHIRDISDADLFAALDLASPALAKVREAAERRDYPAAYAAWAEHWAAAAPQRAHCYIDELVATCAEATAALRQADQQPVLAKAADLLAHRINGWGDVTIQHGPVVDFDANYGAAGKYGFHYWGWAQPLVDAYLLTGDRRYLASFDELFNQWYEQRNHITRTSTNDVVYYELGLGFRNRRFIEYYTLPWAERPARTHERLLKTLLGAARWLYLEEATKGYRRGNWQIITSFGLADIAATVPEFRESGYWLKVAVQRLAEHGEQDFFADGCHSERCPASYMTHAWRSPRNVAWLLDRVPGSAQLAQGLRASLERPLEWWMRTVTPLGGIPGVNDGTPVQLPAAFLVEGARRYGRADFAWVAHHVLGSRDGLPDGTPPPPSAHLEPSGFTVLRSDWTAQARYLLLNHGPSGGGHSHATALDFSLFAYGQAMALDPAIGRTYDDPLHRTWYTTSAAHNMLVVDDRNVDNRVAEGREVAWQTSDTLDYVAATQHGYEADGGVIHRRHVAFVKPDYYLVFDEVHAAQGEHKLSWYLHSPVKLAASGAGFASPAGPGLVIQPSAPWPTRTGRGMACVRGLPGFADEWASIDWVAFEGTVRAGQPARLAVLLYPFPGTPPAVSVREVGQGEFVVQRPGAVDRITFGHNTCTLTRG